MVVSREMDYAVRILRALYRQGMLTTPLIMAREHLPQPITYKLLHKLSQAGFVQGRRGQTGGYILLKDCGKVTLYDLFIAVEKAPLLTECLEPGYQCPNNLSGECLVCREFTRVQHLLEQELQRTTLEQLF